MSAEGIPVEGLSEDGKTFTKLVRDDDKNVNIDTNVNDENNQENDVLGKLDVSTFSEEQRPIIAKLLDGYKALSSENSTLKEKAGLAEVLERTVAQLNQARNDNGQPPMKPVEVKKLSEQLQFGENDYYAPFFKQLATAIDSITEKVSGFDNKIVETRAQSFEDKVKTFVKTNNIPIAVIKQMDEIAAKMGRTVYNDLDRLLKYAKTDLGIKDEPKAQDTTKNKLDNIVQMRSVRKQSNQSTDKPVTSMREAFAKAEDDLTEQD
jgi:hypothetical protein